MQMPIRLSVVGLLAVLCFSLPLPAADAQRASPEQNVLNRFLGTWRTEYTLQKAEWTPVEKTGAADLTYSRVLGDQFVQEDGKDADESTALRMLTYDAEKKDYRTWFFSSSGQANEAKGQWDPKTNTLTWTDVTVAPNGISSTAHHRFLNDDVFEWDVEVREKTGRIVFQLTGKAIRTNKSKK